MGQSCPCSWHSNEVLLWPSAKRSESVNALIFLVPALQVFYISFRRRFVYTNQSVWVLTHPGLMMINSISPRVSDSFAQAFLGDKSGFL